MTTPLWIVAILAFFVVLAIVMVIIGRNAPEKMDPISERLAEFSISDEPLTLAEIELSLTFRERIVWPFFNRIGKIASRFTPQATLMNTAKRLEMSGNPMQLEPAVFLTARIAIGIVFGGLIFVVFAITGRSWAQGLGLSVLFLIVGFAFPDMWLSGRIKSRQTAVFRALPDALDLLLVCVEAGLGFDSSMGKVHEKWNDDLALEFGRVLQEIRLGKLRREALRDMADRLDVPELTSFIAAVIQSEQLGVSMGKVLRIQSEQMRVRRRQMVEEEANKAPIKMVFPIGCLIFPSIMIVLLGPAALMLLGSSMGDMMR